MKEIASILAMAMCMVGTTVASEPRQLSTAGTDFGRVSVDALESALSLSVETDDLEVVETYVVARFQNNAPRKRTTSGFWVPWNGQTDTLTDLSLQPSADGVIEFPLIEEDLSSQFLPITFTVIVRTSTDVRWGYLVVDQ